MTAPTLSRIAEHLDGLLDNSIADSPNAVNGVQLSNRSLIRGIAAAVDFSRRIVDATIAAKANLLILHHGMFWKGVQPIRGAVYERLRLLIEHDIAVYASHLPLDAHPTFGNNALLARALELEPSEGFAMHGDVAIGVRGISDVPTRTLHLRANAFAREHGGEARATPFDLERRTKRWGICTGAGADAATLREAEALGLDTLIVGEGPHWTAVDADDMGLVILYAGHYATETLGVCALSAHLSEEFGVPWTFLPAPTGL